MTNRVTSFWIASMWVASMWGAAKRPVTSRARPFAGLVAVLAVAGLSVSASPTAEAQDAALDFGGGGTVIEGTVFAPEVTILVARDNLLKNYNIVFEESFLDKIVESLEKPPF